MLYSCSQQLKLFFGIAAVGTEQGHCYLVDLRLDDEGEEFDEWHASPVELVNPLSHDMPQLRNSARTNGTHLAIEIGSMLPFFVFFHSTFFSLLSPGKFSFKLMSFPQVAAARGITSSLISVILQMILTLIQCLLIIALNSCASY